MTKKYLILLSVLTVCVFLVPQVYGQQPSSVPPEGPSKSLTGGPEGTTGDQSYTISPSQKQDYTGGPPATGTGYTGTNPQPAYPIERQPGKQSETGAQEGMKKQKEQGGMENQSGTGMSGEQNLSITPSQKQDSGGAPPASGTGYTGTNPQPAYPNR